MGHAALAGCAGALSLNFLCSCGKKKTYPLGVCDWTLGGVGNPGALGTAKLAGLDGVQVSSAAPKPEGEFFTKAQIAEYKKARGQSL